MADNVAITAGSGTTVAADEVVDGTLGTVKVQFTKLMDGTLDSSNKAIVSSGGALKVDNSAVTQPVSGSLTTVSTVTNLSQMAGAAISMGTGVRGTGVQRVTIATDDVVPASQSGTWTVQPGNTANTTAWKVDGSAVTQPVSLASVPSHAVTNAGTFATQATQSGTWTVQPGNTPNTTPWLAKIHDGTTAALVKAASSGAAATTDPAIVVTLRDVNANGSTTDSASAPVAFSTEGKAQLGGVTETAPATDTASSGLNGRLQRIAQRLTSLIALLPTALGGGVKAGALLTTVATDQTWPTGMSPRSFVATFSTLTRPANTTAYTAADSISDNATAGSVTALTATVSDVNDDPITITDIVVNSTDTGLAGKKIRAYLFNSDPTASTGVGAGDNVAYSQKKAGYIGSFMGWMETGFSDGTVGRLVPTFNETNFTQAGGFVVAKPTSGAKTLFIQYQAVEAFTPSASSTTIIGSARGFQGRAS